MKFEEINVKTEEGQMLVAAISTISFLMDKVGRPNTPDSIAKDLQEYSALAFDEGGVKPLREILKAAEESIEKIKGKRDGKPKIPGIACDTFKVPAFVESLNKNGFNDLEITDNVFGSKNVSTIGIKDAEGRLEELKDAVNNVKAEQGWK